MNRTIVALAVILMTASPVVAQETTSIADMRAILADLRDGSLDDFEATPRMSKLFEKQEPRTRIQLRALGQVENVVFWDTYKGLDLFLVSCKSGRLVVRIKRSYGGEITTLRYWRVAG